jgi:hypothetical protein
MSDRTHTYLQIHPDDNVLVALERYAKRYTRRF